MFGSASESIEFFAYLEDDEIQYVAFFYGTDYDCFGSIDNDEEQCRTQNKEKELLYVNSEIRFLIGCLLIQGQ